MPQVSQCRKKKDSVSNFAALRWRLPSWWRYSWPWSAQPKIKVYQHNKRRIRMDSAYWTFQTRDQSACICFVLLLQSEFVVVGWSTVLLLVSDRRQTTERLTHFGMAYVNTIGRVVALFQCSVSTMRIETIPNPSRVLDLCHGWQGRPLPGLTGHSA